MGPGPAAYEVKSHIGHGPKATIAGRRETKGPGHLGPGPGAYNTHVEPIGSSSGKSPRYTIAGRNDRSKHQAPTPGPGSYVSDLGRVGTAHNSQKITISGRYKTDDERKLKTPGPGAYNTAVEAIGSARGKSPRYTIRSSRKVKEDIDDNPGKQISLSLSLSYLTHPRVYSLYLFYNHISYILFIISMFAQVLVLTTIINHRFKANLHLMLFLLKNVIKKSPKLT